MKKLQVIQNRACRIITKTRLREKKTNKHVNERAMLEPINIVLNNMAKNIWEKMELNNEQIIKTTFNANNFNIQFQSSRELCSRTIEPQF